MLFADGKHDDTSALQEMLDRRGEVRIEKPGVYLVSKTLIVHSGTRLTVAPGAVLLAAPMSRCALIENEHFAGGGTDENIEIAGGVWDGNCDAMGIDAVEWAKHRLDNPYSPSRFMGKLIRFAHTEKIILSGLTVRNPVSYGIQIGAVRGFAVRDIFFDYNRHYGTTDGVHINGPARDGVIENLCGTTNDDLVSLTAYDEEHAEISKGDISDVSIRNISARNGYCALRLLSGEGYSVCSVHVDGIYGDYRHNTVIISNHNDRPGDVWFDNIVIENVFARKSYTPLGDDCFRYWEGHCDRNAIICFGNKARCGNVVLRNVLRRELQATEAPLLELAENASIDYLHLDNVRQSAVPGCTVPMWKIGGTIKEQTSTCGEFAR